jgi:glycine/D-amino acid oxidase-like deaminating enzyme
MFDVARGSTIPGLGRVESIKRQDGKWVVVTAHGTIMSAR